MNDLVLRSTFFAGLLAFTSQAIVDAQTCDRQSTLTIHCLDQGVYFGAALKHEADFARLSRLGVRRIIDVRTFKVFASAAERRLATKYGMQFQRVPTGFFPTKTGTGTVPQIMSALKNDRCGPVYFHCNLGSDRTGMLAAIYRTEVLGWDSSCAFQHWKSDQFNPKLQDLDRYYWQRVGQCCQPIPIDQSQPR